MKSKKCVECGFVGWADATNCKACGADLSQQQSHNLPLPPPVSNTQYNHWHEPQRPQSTKDGLAIFSLVLGCIGFFTLGLLLMGAITGTVTGWIAMTRAKREPWRYGGRGIAIAGFVLNVAALVWVVPIGAAIVIPNLLAARRAANEGAAISTMRTMSMAQAEHLRQFGKYGTLDELAEHDLIEHKLATGTKNGYNFAIELTTDENDLRGFAITGVPITYPTTGGRSFYVDETLVVRWADNSGGPATKLDLPLGEYSSSPQRRADNRRQTVY
jgi:type IV pilus assembly protein PilA